MKKDFTVLSKKRCINCGQELKQNLVDKNPTATRCYKCHQANIRKNPRYIET